MRQGTVLKLTPLTRHGKNVVERFGTAFWEVVRTESEVAALKGEPGILIRATPWREHSLRWIEARDCRDFKVEEVT